MRRFALVTYNILAQSYVYPERYHRSGAAPLRPAYRSGLVISRIEEMNPDILCLQELEPNIFDMISERMAPTHHRVYVQRTGRPEGVAIFARRELFGWEGHQVLHFQAHRRDRDDLALITELTLDGRPLHLCCTHLARQPEVETHSEHLGYLQMAELLDHRDRTAPEEAWIVAGDLNATRSSLLVSEALSRGLDDSCLRQHPNETCVVDGEPYRLDYVLVSAGQFTSRPHLLQPLTDNTIMPSLTEPSDHLPLRVDLKPTW